MAMTSQDGFLSPFLNAGIDLFKDGNTEAREADSRHHPDTEANWSTVKVAGLGKAFRIVFEDVFVRADVKYHPIHSACPR